MDQTSINPLELMDGFRNGTATLEALFRGLMSYSGWISPSILLKQFLEFSPTTRQELVTKTSIYPPNTLWLFTDEATLQDCVKQDAQVGLCAFDLPGYELFSRVSPMLQGVIINPFSEPGKTFCIESQYIPMARGWGEAIQFEQALIASEPLDAKQKTELLKNSPALIVFVHPDQAIVTMPNIQGLKNPALVFTAPDCIGEFLLELEVEQSGKIQQYFTDGKELLERLPNQGVDGLIVNICGPGPAFALGFQ